MSDGSALQGGWGERFKLRLSAIVWFLLGAGFLLSLPVLLDISVLAVLAVLSLALVLCLPAAWQPRSNAREGVDPARWEAGLLSVEWRRSRNRVALRSTTRARCSGG